MIGIQSISEKKKKKKKFHELAISTLKTKNARAGHENLKMLIYRHFWVKTQRKHKNNWLKGLESHDRPFRISCIVWGGSKKKANGFFMLNERGKGQSFKHLLILERKAKKERRFFDGEL